MSHDHAQCDHDMKFCSERDLAYCGKCPREWGGMDWRIFVSPDPDATSSITISSSNDEQPLYWQVSS